MVTALGILVWEGVLAVPTVKSGALLFCYLFQVYTILYILCYQGLMLQRENNHIVNLLPQSCLHIRGESFLPPSQWVIVLKKLFMPVKQGGS